MWYWVVMFVLVVGCVCMLTVSFKSIKKNKAMAARVMGSRRRRDESDYEYDEDEYDVPPRRRQAQ